MRSKLSTLLLASALGACGHVPQDLPARGVNAVNVPVVERADYVFNAAAPGGTLQAEDAIRLNDWFRSLNLGYGDTVYVDGPYSDAARNVIGQITGHYGLLVEPGAPILAGQVAADSVRVIVSRNRAVVPNCPNWSDDGAQTNYQNRSMSNFGCAVNSNIAAMIANPEDLIHGREGSGVIDPQTGVKALSTYRAQAPTGAGALKSVSTKGN